MVYFLDILIFAVYFCEVTVDEIRMNGRAR